MNNAPQRQPKEKAMAWKRLRQQKHVKPRLKIRWEQLGLATPAKERPTIPMEEIRRQVMMLAGRSLGQGVRSSRLVQGKPNSDTDRPVETVRRDRRGATR